MKHGIVLPSYLYNDTRKMLATAAFYSLGQTQRLSQPSRLLLLVRNLEDYKVFLPILSASFAVTLKEDMGLGGTEQTLAFGTQWLLEQHGVEWITWMGDDALFHPEWLWKLQGLMARHPSARSWSVYRSAHEKFHKTIRQEGDDVLVSSICGHGLTITAKEWLEWGIRWEDKGWACAAGDTLDLVHVQNRSGERWVTSNSFVQHTAPHAGQHCTQDTPEYAQNWVGE